MCRFFGMHVDRRCVTRLNLKITLKSEKFFIYLFIYLCLWIFIKKNRFVWVRFDLNYNFKAPVNYISESLNLIIVTIDCFEVRILIFIGVKIIVARRAETIADEN